VEWTIKAVVEVFDFSLIDGSPVLYKVNNHVDTKAGNVELPEISTADLISVMQV
jgi:hypothetical protein